MAYFNRKGYSLSEVMIAMSIFAIISMVLMAMFMTGTKYWKDIEARGSVETSFNKSFYDINSVLRNSSLKFISCGSDLNLSGHGFLACASAIKLNDSGIPMESEFDYSPDSGISWNFQILYFTANRPKSCEECDNIFGEQSPYCPHKYLVKRWYSRHENVSNAGIAGKWSSVEADYSHTDQSFTPSEYSYKNGDKILSTNILAFKAFKKPDNTDSEPKTVMIAMKCFKNNRNIAIPSKSDFQQSINFFYNSLNETTDTESPVIGPAVMTSVMSVTPLNTPVVAGD